jgi:hypothetical protein
MKTKTSISMLIALIAILVSSCNEVTHESNNHRMKKNYPFMKELNGSNLVDSAFNRIYSLEICPYTKGSLDYIIVQPLPQQYGIRITVTEISKSPKERVIFEDLLFDGSLDYISTLSAEDRTFYESDKDNLPELLKQNQARYNCLIKRVSALANAELMRIHYMQTMRVQSTIVNLVPCE